MKKTFYHLITLALILLPGCGGVDPLTTIDDGKCQAGAPCNLYDYLQAYNWYMSTYSQSRTFAWVGTGDPTAAATFEFERWYYGD